MDNVQLSVNEIAELAEQCLRRHGCDGENAAAVANVIAAAERDGCHSHGLMRLAGYVAALDSGKVDGKARPVSEQLAPAVIRVNANGGFAPLALQHGREPLARCARSQGIAALAVVNCHHFAALWGEVEPLAEMGLCALACTSYMPAVIPAGGQQALYGTNPVAFGWPRPGRPPMVFDQASSVMAKGEVMLAAREGHSLPPGVGVDADGQPSTDPDEILKGALLAFGGHKGSSIALMVELLAGALIGECHSFEAAERDNKDGGPPRGGEFILAMDPARFGDPDGWAEHAEGLFSRVLAQSGTRLPADRRHENRTRAMKEGVAVSRAVHDRITAL